MFRAAAEQVLRDAGTEWAYAAQRLGWPSDPASLTDRQIREAESIARRGFAVEGFLEVWRSDQDHGGHMYGDLAVNPGGLG